jgi:VWFA-related protein
MLKILEALFRNDGKVYCYLYKGGATMKKISLVFFLICSFFLQTGISEAPAFPAQSKTEPSQESLQYEVTVTLKLVQVYVTDPEGNPALDLEKSDFVLYDNGKLQNITDFEKHFLYVPEEKPIEFKLPPAKDVQSVMNRKFFFLIDYENNDLEGVAKSRNAALEFTEAKAQPGDEIALLSYSTIRGLVLHEYLTSDHEKVRAAIKKIHSIPGVRGGWDSGAALGHSVMGMEADVGPISITDTERRGASIRFSNQIKDLAKALRHIPGQKNIILFSRGYGRSILIPGAPTAEAFLAMTKELASANCPVFSVNTITGWGKIKVLPEDALDYLSKQTGGKYYHDVNYYSTIAEDVQNATSNYYVLGYSIESTWDGKYHDIKVEVKRAGYKVHAQRGYFNPLPFNLFSPVEKHFHLLALALGEQAYFEPYLNFPMTALPFSDRKELNTLLISEIPVQRIREVVGDNTEFISLIFDQNKTIVDSRRIVIDWRTNEEEKIYQYSTAALAPGQYDCRVVIRNLDNGKGAVGACFLEMPEAADQNLMLYPPLLLIPGQETNYLHVFDPEREGAAKSVSFLDVFPFQPKEYIPLIGELEQRVSQLYAVLRCIWAGAQEPEIQISAWLEPKGSGKKISLACHILSSVPQEEADVIFLEIEVPELQPGQYLLHLLAEDPDTKSSCQTTSGVSVGTSATQKR